MPTIMVRDIPERVRDVLAGRAASSGQSMQQYLRRELIGLAEKPTVEELLERAAARAKSLGTRLSADEILAHRDAGRK